MRSRVTLAIVAAVSVISGVTLTLAAHPSTGGAQVVSTPTTAGPTSGRYQLAVLPSRNATDDREWLVLDTETGGVAHWRESGKEYVGYTQIGDGRQYTLRTRVPKRDPSVTR